MIKSMTGYGRREATLSGTSVVAEVRAVNHRHCEIVTRLPKALASREDEFKKQVQARCQRGRIEVTVSLSGKADGEKMVSLDHALAKQYYRMLYGLQKELRLKGTIDLALLAGFRDIVTLSEKPQNDHRLGTLAARLLSGALSDLDAMRRREGQALARDTRQRLKLIEETVAAVEARAPKSVEAHFERMKARVAALTASPQVDAGRLAQELAIYADRSDVTEELTRLRSHLAQFEGALKNPEPVGRTLDFLLQEIGREVNTVGSKANDAEIGGHVVRLKAELEKIREQVQNVE